MSKTVKNSAGTEQNKKNTLVIVLIILLAIVLIAFVAVVSFLLGRGQNNNDTDQEETRREVTSSVRAVVDESNMDNIVEEMREEVAEGMFECQMSMTWTFEDGKSESKDAYVANSVNNTHPICFDVYLKDTEELVYSSPVLPVGTDLSNIKLDKELPKGEYKATVMYNLLQDVETQEEISTAGFIIKIKVLN